MDSLNASSISLLDTSKVLGKPDTKSLPLASTVFMISFPSPSFSINALPTVTFRFSAVFIPIKIPFFFLRYPITLSLILSPAYLSDVLTTKPPKDKIATSVVPPPISAIMDASLSSIFIPAPIAAAVGSSKTYTSFPPVSLTTSKTALLSTSVTPLGTPTTTLKLLGFFSSNACCMKCCNISAVISKSEITPSCSGFTTSIFLGAFPYMDFALVPVAIISLVYLS